MDERTRMLDRGGVRSAIGSARHRLVELVAEGCRDGREAPLSSWVRSQFDHLLNEERVKLQQQWSPAEVPPIRTWPDIALTRARLARALGSADGTPWPERSSPGLHGGGAAGPPAQLVPRSNPKPLNLGEVKVEMTLRDFERGFWGRIDRLENRSGTLTVVDLKSGIGLLSEQLADRHRAQMLFYAGLVEATFGTWPELELVPVDGSPIPIDYQPADAEAVRAAAAEDRAALNAVTSRGSLPTDAQATPLRCAWCPFQVVCPVFVESWPAFASPDSPPLHRAVSLVRGEVKEVRNRESATELVISQTKDLTAAAGDVIVTRLPPGPWAEVGSEVAVSRVAPSSSDRVLRATWGSLIWPVPQDARASISG